MDDFEECFQALDEMLSENVPTESTCCDVIENYQENQGVIVCRKCSQLITNIIDGPEWRFYGGESKGGNPSRCGMAVNPLLPQSSLGSSMSGYAKNHAMKKIGQYQMWNSMPYGERSLYKVFVEIDTKCQKGGLPKIISQTAKSLYRILSETKVSRGSNRTGVIAACVYNACKECGVPRSPNEISQMFDIESKIMTKGCKNYTEIMRMSKGNKNRITDLKSINLDDFIERFAYNLKFSETEIQVIMRLSSVSQDLGLISDNTPASMAAGCIYLFSKYRQNSLTKKEISDVCKISEVTINKCMKKLESNKDMMTYLQSHLDILQES
tara:strand:- start:1171 stop:2145 length:975 start_codon:yes stop_codon:yes gene_type:complete